MKDGTPLAAGSLAGEQTMLVTMVNLAIVEFDLEGQASNPFKTMDLTGKDAPVEAEGTKGEPLFEEAITAKRSRLRDHVKEKAAPRRSCKHAPMLWTASTKSALGCRSRPTQHRARWRLAPASVHHPTKDSQYGKAAVLSPRLETVRNG